MRKIQAVSSIRAPAGARRMVFYMNRRSAGKGVL